MMTRRNILLGSLLFTLSLTNCDTSKRPNTEAVKEEMASREIKKVSDAEIMIAGEKLGLSVLDTIQKKFQHELLTALREKGVPGAISYCNLNASSLVRGFEDSLNISVKRVTDKPRNPADTLSDFEKTIFEAYQYNPDLAGAQIQELDKQALILTKPIKITNGACLNCHGKVGEQVTETNYTLIRSLYPRDKATGYQLNDLRGMWSIVIPKKTVVNQL